MDLLEILGKIGFDWRMSLSNLVNFLIIFWLLKRFAFSRLQQSIQERRQKIDEGLENAKKAETDLMMAKTKYEETLAEARRQANELVAQAHEQGEQVIKQAVERAEAKVREMAALAKEQIAQDRARLEQEIQAKTVTVALALSEKILGKKLDQDADKKFIESLR